MTRPPVIGLVGGVASGKTTVAQMMGALGARVLDADALAHEALETPEIHAAVVARFGKGIEGADGRIDRTRLRPLVFGTSPEVVAARRFLEGRIHPEVRRRLAAGITAATAADRPPFAVVLDVPLLIEGPVKDACDALVFVETSATTRFDRTKNHRNWSESDHRAREAAQANLDEKRQLCPHVIRNDGSLDDLRAAVAALFPTLLASARGHRGRP